MAFLAVKDCIQLKHTAHRHSATKNCAHRIFIHQLNQPPQVTKVAVGATWLLLCPDLPGQAGVLLL
jgi:hypothetical protein